MHLKMLINTLVVAGAFFAGSTLANVDPPGPPEIVPCMKPCGKCFANKRCTTVSSQLSNVAGGTFKNAAAGGCAVFNGFACGPLPIVKY